jgi:hypothetical protein
MIQSFPLCRIYAQNGWTEIIGNYFLESDSKNLFPELDYFTLVPVSYYKNIDTAHCFIHLNKSCSSDTLDSTNCSFKEIYLTNDSLSFSSDNCQNNQYSFSGEFLVPLSEVYHNMSKAVLKGFIKWYKNGQLLRKGRVIFTFEKGC